MKRIINSKTYDTDTATNLGRWTNGLYPNDMHYVYETMYRTPRGLYFVHGEGGADSKYSQQSGSNSWSGGERIMPMTLTEAQAWAEKHLDGDEYIAAFGEPDEEPDEDLANKKRMNFSLSLKTIDLLRVEAERRGGNHMSQIIDEAVAAYLSKGYE